MVPQQVKGTGLIPVVAYIRDHFGDDGWGRVVEFLPPQLRSELAHKIMEIKWYPLELVSEIYNASARTFAGGDLSLCRDIGKAAADYGLSRIYKFFLRFGSPQMFGSRGPEMWKTYYTGSALKVLANDKGRILVELQGLLTSDAHFQSIVGWMERAGELTGGRNIRMNPDVPSRRVEILYD
ncbi:MAG TPA: hypothetical protein DDW31_04425 [candidate division Zixibacteria bacterium]|jgi:hypothetical protein|nr:hypothetical protein [candidate division Zixibacteria bacterium]